MATPVRAATQEQVAPFLVSSNGSQMHVRKRNGSLEPADVNKIVRVVERCCDGLHSVDAIRIASKTIGGLFNGATTKELDLQRPEDRDGNCVPSSHR
jgi:ribonucleoside-diphosphate reductase alpha chain